MSDRIAEVSALFAASTIDELELTGPDGSIRLVRRADGTVREASAGMAQPAPAAVGSCVVRAPHAGVFLDRHPLHAEPVVEPHASIRTGDHVGYVRLGQFLLVPAISPVTGQVVEVKAGHGDVVGFGEPLVDVEPTISPDT